MKKFLSGLLMCSFLTVALPVKKAEAGFMVLAATQEFVWKHKYETLDTVLVIALPVTMITTGIFAVGIAGMPINNASLIAGAICLDQNLEAHRSEVTSALLQRYPFIDDESVVESLADKIIPKYEGAKDKDGNAMIILSEEEIIDSVRPLDLSSQNLQELLATLAK